MLIAGKSPRTQSFAMIFGELWRAGLTFRQSSERSHHFWQAVL